MVEHVWPGYVHPIELMDRFFSVGIYSELISKPWPSLPKVELRGVELWEDYGNHHPVIPTKFPTSKALIK